MIYIIDNGGHWSAHGIFFLDVPEHLLKYREYIEPLLLYACGSYNREDAHILGVTDRIDWWKGGAPDFSEHVYWNTFIEDAHDRSPKARWVVQPTPDDPNRTPRGYYTDIKLKVPDEVMRHLLERWRTRVVQLDDEPPEPPEGENPRLKPLFDAVEEMVNNGELKP